MIEIKYYFIYETKNIFLMTKIFATLSGNNYYFLNSKGEGSAVENGFTRNESSGFRWSL